MKNWQSEVFNFSVSEGDIDDGGKVPTEASSLRGLGVTIMCLQLFCYICIYVKIYITPLNKSPFWHMYGNTTDYCHIRDKISWHFDH